MDVQINEISTDISVTDERALLSPRVMALIIAEVKRHLEEAERLRNQRNADRSPDARGRR